jgi:hypothetical protein
MLYEGDVLQLKKRSETVKTLQNSNVKTAG